MIPYGSLVVYASASGKKYTKKLEEGKDWHTNDGCIASTMTHDANFGDVIFTNRGVPVRLEEATLFDRLMALKRQTQIIYPKDIAYICLKLGAGPGRLIAEAGCGSGGLTTALSWFCGPTGKIVSHDSREEFVKLARKNLDWAGVGENVEIFCQDIAQGFAVRDADSLFLDVREPWLYLEQALEAVRPGAALAFLIPTTNQIEELLLALEQGPFAEIEICELLLRRWKPVPDRLRPEDRMSAHTGFLVFCRQQEKSEEFIRWLPRDTRERKQDAARDARTMLTDEGRHDV